MPGIAAKNRLSNRGKDNVSTRYYDTDNEI
jgi:hypothetical protein